MFKWRCLLNIGVLSWTRIFSKNITNIIDIYIIF
nr:MAG TPA: hypothetical protein [Caudoviricetes sp.]DAS25520.1 MAG TPA: hypothetical protein [Bacteriophage sp.]DAW66420.1 MAG TPA: hypothetical protein [Bacteriophage sp.]DAY36466.1 MAG TPA: hypothetical protein [Bacteriophage sp.]